MSLAIMGRALVLGVAVGLATALLVGVPAAVIETPWFVRMTPVRPLDYLVLTVTALLSGVLGATYALPVACDWQEHKLLGGGLLSLLAVGCPTCNKVVVLLLGASGALAYFEPVQPLLAVASLALLATAVWLRLRAVQVGGRVPPLA